MDGHAISAKEFTELALGTRFDTGIQDANRPSAYGYTNGDFKARKAKYLPSGEGFRGVLPLDWNADVIVTNAVTGKHWYSTKHSSISLFHIHITT